ncbi:IS701 family transposase, partial [Rubidibacter lacunae]
MDFSQLLQVFAPLFSVPVWRSALLLATGAVLAPGKRTVTSALRVLGLAHTRQYPNFHRVLSRARWSPLAASQLLLNQLLATFAPTGPLLLVIDDTIERRWGRRIAARGIYRDPVRSSRDHCVKASGLRWLSLMLLVKVPWAQRLWALPVLTALTPSARYNQQQGRRHQTLTDWARQMVTQVRRWLPRRQLMLIADSSFAALDLLAALTDRSIHTITRLRLDAALYEPAPPR